MKDEFHDYDPEGKKPSGQVRREILFDIGKELERIGDQLERVAENTRHGP